MRVREIGISDTGAGAVVVDVKTVTGTDVTGIGAEVAFVGIALAGEGLIAAVEIGSSPFLKAAKRLCLSLVPLDLLTAQSP